MTREIPNSNTFLQSLIDLVKTSLARQQDNFAGRINNETDERSVRLTGLLDATFELYKSYVPGMDIALTDVTNRRNLADNLSVEYVPLLMLDPAELPRAFAQYILWKFGTDRAAEQVVDLHYLKEIFERGLSLLPPDTQEATISLKHQFEWGRLV